MKRKIVKIDEGKCNGCGLCVPSCNEGAIQVVDGKARLVKDSYCDGLGACLGECPQGAITLEERDAEEFDQEAVNARMKVQEEKNEVKPKLACGCPGTMVQSFAGKSDNGCGEAKNVPSQLRQWPVQLHLVPVNASYWQNADILVAADCVSVAYGDFQRLLKGKKVVIACPKLDETDSYVDKLAEILILNSIRSITVAFMEVPCCTGIVHIVENAVSNSGKETELKLIKIGMEGGAEEIN